MIIIFPAGSEDRAREVGIVPEVAGDGVGAVRLGAPAVDLTGRMAFSHDFGEAQIRWVTQYLSDLGETIFVELPADWQFPRGEPDIPAEPPVVDTSFVTDEKPDQGEPPLPDNAALGRRPAANAVRIAQRDQRFRQWVPNGRR